MEALTGIWGCERVLGPELRGNLRVLKAGSNWHASIMGLDASARVQGEELSFVFPGNRGEFRAREGGVDEAFIGHWIQPGGIANRNVYATPVEMVPGEDGGGVWRGEVVPLDDRIAIYLVIEQSADGGVTAFVRDPEANAGLWLRIEKVAVEGDKLRLLSSNHGEIVGRYDAQGDSISIELPFYPLTLHFTRRNRNSAIGFYPRTPETGEYKYRPPAAEGDGWQTGSLADVSLDPGPITALVESILQTRTTDVRTPFIQGLLVARHGLLVLEEYFYGFDKDRPHDMRSATKSLSTTLVGVAINTGASLGVTAPVVSFFPEYRAYAHDDARKRRMTVEHLLTMTSGLACDDNDDESPGGEDKMQAQQEQSDWYKYTLDLPIVHEPGEKAVYCSAGIHLLGGAIAKATGEWLPEFFYEQFAGPLDFGLYHAQLMPPLLSTMYLGGGSYLRPRDLMKLGQIFLNGGRWNGKQIVSRDWVERSLQAHSHFENHDYGYGWHLGEYNVAGQTYARAEAGGNGGQFVIIIPTLDLVVMFTAANYGNWPVWSKFRDVLVPKYIIPAALA